jgi:mono/diheme cytochrome c family protein
MKRWFVGMAFVTLLAGLLLLGLHTVDEGRSAPTRQSQARATDADVARGAYLARAGNCQHCHTARGAAEFAGGRAIETPFGTVFSSNLTPDRETGIGSWSAQDFWQAMHHGRSKDGRWLLPAFPYGEFTRIRREDSDALFAWLSSQAPVRQPNRAHTLSWPYSSQWALGAWRVLYFRSGTFEPDVARSEQWNRGAYLVQGLGHCSACHAARNTLGASTDAGALTGGLIPMRNWYAPSLASSAEAGVQDWAQEEIVQLLQTGTSARGWASGPMAEVVLHSTQYLTSTDLAAMARYLKDLPARLPVAAVALVPVQDAAGASHEGAKLYKLHCAACHGEAGQGVPRAYPALAGNRAVTMASSTNLVQTVLNGGFAAATAGNPRPFGMPPFALSLGDHEIAAVLSHIRSAWGNRAGEVSTQDVDRLRSHAAR